MPFAWYTGLLTVCPCPPPEPFCAQWFLKATPTSGPLLVKFLLPFPCLCSAASLRLSSKLTTVLALPSLTSCALLSELTYFTNSVHVFLLVTLKHPGSDHSSPAYHPATCSKPPWSPVYSDWSPGFPLSALQSVLSEAARGSLQKPKSRHVTP